MIIQLLIIITRSVGTVKVLYDPRLSQKGALLTASKAPRRERDVAVDRIDDHIIVGEIVNPHALPMYRVEPSDKKRSREMKDPILTKLPGQSDSQTIFFVVLSELFFIP